MIGRITLTLTKEIDGKQVDEPIKASFEFNDYGNSDSFAARDKFLTNDKEYYLRTLQDLIPLMVLQLK